MAGPLNITPNDLDRRVLEMSDTALDAASAALELTATLIECLGSEFRPSPAWIRKHTALQAEAAAGVARLRTELERLYLGL